ncbi:MAG TPA: TetR/AcrR family transcriptional regulator [Solirubrobacteraceae bacterium]|nr:TetR/AcrR family transcriptional regulator [Solirubrobacteraceae bacterium]
MSSTATPLAAREGVGIGACRAGTARATAHAQVVAIQRSRLLVAAVGVADELGYAHTTVGRITRRARVSRRTFYELFTDREDCLLAVFDDALARVAWELADAGLAGCNWRERVRFGLEVILAFFDREPALARVCVVHSLQGGSRLLERRAEALGVLAGMVDEGEGAAPRGVYRGRLVAEGLVGAAAAIVHNRLLEDPGTPLLGLAGDLAGLMVLPYLGSAAARREQQRRDLGASPARRPTDTRLLPGATGDAARATHGSKRGQVQADGAEPDLLEDLPMRITYRTARVLEDLAASPGASNRQVAAHAEIADQGQVSKLLARLQRLGLLVNTAEEHGRGLPNAWALTPRGEQMAHSIAAYRRKPEPAGGREERGAIPSDIDIERERDGADERS